MQVSVRSSVRPCIRPSVNISLGCLVSATLLTVLYHQFETLHVFSLWYEDVHVVWIYVLPLFSHYELSHFSPFIYIQLVPLVSATPLIVLYRLLRNFACVFFMAWGYACGLDIIIRSFVFTFFHIVNVIFHPLYIDSGYLVSTTPHAILYQSFWKFARFLLSLRMCMCFTYNFWHFILLFVTFWPQMYRQWVPCDCNFSYNFKPVLLNKSGV